MPSAIDPTKPRDGESARKADTRTNLAAIKADLVSAL